MVKALYIATTDGEFKQTQSLHFDEGGIIGSKHHNSKIERSVLLSSTLTYEKVKKNKINIKASALGENILLEAFDLAHLKPFKKFQIGNVIFEITQNCTLCRGLSQLDARLPKLLKDDRGIFAKVIQAGIVTVGDTLELL